MNAAARLVHQHVWIRQFFVAQFLSWQKLLMLFLIVSVISSALCTIYVTHMTRILHANYQRNLAEQDQLNVERGQLLLERSTWMIQARIQQMAEDKLGMYMPDHKAVVIIHE